MMDGHPFQGDRVDIHVLLVASWYRTGISAGSMGHWRLTYLLHNDTNLKLSVLSISFLKEFFCSKFQDGCQFLFVKWCTPLKRTI